MNEPRFLHVPEATKVLNQHGYPITSPSIRAAIKRKRFPHYRIASGRNYLIPIREVIAMLEGEEISESWFHGNPPALGA